MGRAGCTFPSGTVPPLLHATQVYRQQHLGSLLEIYPTDNAHLKMVLEPFEVCWRDGVSYPQSEASVSDAAGHAIMCNVPFRNAHHDLLIPVKRVKCGTCEYIAAQCRYGVKKTAKDLNDTCQDKARKPKKNEARDTLPDMPNVLLQICPED